ncbi:MAG: DUF1587 domain-containing protein, partial [Deltaproteobacteria bacterium]|nr:DUF1587 domain-containing protein [Deltaproteobacteria bacterium]
MWTTWPGNSRRVTHVSVFLGAGLLAIAACSSSPAGKDQPPKLGPLCETRDPGPSPLRRLTRIEYARAVRDLIGPGLLDSSGLPPDERALGFDNNADVLGTSDLLIEQYQDLAERAASVVAADITRFVPCAAATADATCARTFVDSFGRRAWRRPLEATETGALMSVFTTGQA